MRRGSPYLIALASPGALRFSAAGILGRMPISMFGLGTVLLIASITGRYALARSGRSRLGRQRASFPQSAVCAREP